MTKITLRMVLMLGVLAVLVVGVSGCTGIQNPITGGQTSQVNAYANAFVSSFKANLGAGESLVSSNVVQNGSNAMQVTLTVANATSTSIWSNGSMDTYALNIKQFDNTNDASNFYNSTTFGYNPGAATGGVSTTNNTNAYEQVMGHAPTISRYATQIVSLSLLGGSINIAAQQGEFVIYGAATVVPGASGSGTSSATPASSVVPTSSPSGSPSSNPSPTPSPIVTPTPTPTPTPAQVTISFNGANEISHGAVFELSAIVMQGNTPVTTGTVTFSLAGQTYTATQTDSSGIAGRWTSPQFSPITQVGPYTATAAYTGPAGTASTTLQITVT